MYLAADRFARWAWHARGGRGDIKREFRKKAKDKRKSEPSKCSGLAISGRRQGHICEDTFAYGSYSSKDNIYIDAMLRFILTSFNYAINIFIITNLFLP